MRKVFCEVDAIVGGPWLFAKRHNLPIARAVELKEALAEAMPYHAVADDHYRLTSLANHKEPLRTTGVRTHPDPLGKQIRYRLFPLPQVQLLSACPPMGSARIV